MSILIATPCYGAQVTAPHFKSCLELRSALIEGGVDHDWLLGWNESLIQRARNSMAASFLETRYEKLLFIDADISFEPESVAKLWNMQADVAVGAYPMKKVGAPLAAWVDGQLKDLNKLDGVTEIEYAGTGFMMIDRSVFERFREAYPEREHEEGPESKRSFAWFNPRVHDGFYISEDYAFCHDFREIGGSIWCDPTIRLGHWGMYCYGESNDD